MDTETLYKPYIDTAYRDFSMKLTKNIDRPYIGVRLPVLRKLAKEIEDIDFPVVYHEDVLLRGFWIGRQKLPFNEKLKLIDNHIQYLETWDEVDCFASEIKPKPDEKDTAYSYFMNLIRSSNTMTRRFGIIFMMKQRKSYSDKTEEILEAITAADNDEYYVSMAVAWALTTFYMDDNSIDKWFGRISQETLKRTQQKIWDSIRERKPKQ